MQLSKALVLTFFFCQAWNIKGLSLPEISTYDSEIIVDASDIFTSENGESDNKVDNLPSLGARNHGKASQINENDLSLRADAKVDAPTFIPLSPFYSPTYIASENHSSLKHNLIVYTKIRSGALCVFKEDFTKISNIPLDIYEQLFQKELTMEKAQRLMERLNILQHITYSSNHLGLKKGSRKLRFKCIPFSFVPTFNEKFQTIINDLESSSIFLSDISLRLKLANFAGDFYNELEENTFIFKLDA